MYFSSLILSYISIFRIVLLHSVVASMTWSTTHSIPFMSSVTFNEKLQVLQQHGSRFPGRSGHVLSPAYQLYSSTQLGASGAGHGASDDQDESARKRKRSEICKASRKRVKQDKEMLKDSVAALNVEISKEEMTNRNLDVEKRMMNEKLKLVKTRKTELLGEFGEKEKEVANQNKKLEELSNDPNLGLQPGFSSLDIEMLRNELAVLTNTNWYDWESEKSELEKEISELERENSKLKTRCQVLGEMIVQDWKQGNPFGH